MTVLQRLMAKRLLIYFAAILCTIIILVDFFDLLFRFDIWMKIELPEGRNRAWHIFESYLVRIPALISSFWTFAFSLATLVCIGMVVRRKEALICAGGGLSPLQHCRSLIILASLLGIFGWIIGDQIGPRVDNGGNSNSHLWQDTRIWEDSDRVTWYAQRALISAQDDPEFKRCAAMHQDGSALITGGMYYQDGKWQIELPAYMWIPGEPPTYTELTSNNLPDNFTINHSPDTLRRHLISREQLSMHELWLRNDQLHHSLMYSRLAAIFLPLFALFYLLPFAYRIQGSNMIQAAKALGISLIPMIILALASLSADTSKWPPALVLGISLLLIAGPTPFLLRRLKHPA